MSPVLPPPSERFDPITARWLTPGGPLHDPERGELDDESVRLLDPVPPELLHPAESSGTDSLRRFRWAILVVLVLGVIGIVVTGIVGF